MIFVTYLESQDSNYVNIEASTTSGSLEMQTSRKTFPTKPIFSVEEYSQEVMSWFSDESSQFRFEDIIKNNPKWRYEKADVCRLFLTTLHLANSGQ